VPDVDRKTEEGRRSIVYSLVPRAAPAAALSVLRRLFATDDRVRVIVERRGGERRGDSDRRDEGSGAQREEDRRRVRSEHGRRVGEQRAGTVAVESPRRLPETLGKWVERLRFVERQPAGRQAIEDLETGRLVVRLQAGDRDAFDEIYERYVTRVYGYVRVSLRDEHEAEDVTHEVFLSVLQALPGYRISGAPFRTWLFRIARNQVLNHARKHRRVDVMEAGEVARRIEGVQAAREIEALRLTGDEDLLNLVQTLPIAQRQVVVLRYAMDFDVKEIAEILDRSPNAVSQLQQRAFTILRARLVATGRHADTDSDRLAMRMRTRDSGVALSRRLALTY
jgi:RNA polymerase sigma-70 factor, ECF subfamily